MLSFGSFKISVKLILILFIICLPLVVPFKASAKLKGQVLVVNQVRGQECCDIGSIENLEKQIEIHVKNNVPALFVLRYDALNDANFTEILIKNKNEHPELISLGLLLEITPQLAKDAGVSYRGPVDNWFEAQQLYSIGYSDSDNIKIGDLLFEKFSEKFGYYPSLTSSWMIKTSFLNYLTDKYGVKIHQITREQLGTDSYSLYGGPPHYPYPASRNWVFMPDYSIESNPIIVRQTITDPIDNYGDESSSFTSQPNDYLKNKDFSYFKYLFSQALSQPAEGFALLGLENSMDEKYFIEYEKQINWLGSKKTEIAFPALDDISIFWKKRKINLYFGEKDNQKALWVSTPNYRIRLRISDKDTFISDIRLFSNQIKDPYQNKLAKREGFWIAPFLLDGSIFPKKMPLFSLEPPSSANKFINPEVDRGKNSSRIVLPVSTDKVSAKPQELLYTSYKREVRIKFLEEKVEFLNLKANDFKFKQNNLQAYPVAFKQNAIGFSLDWKNWLNLTNKCLNSLCTFNFSIDPLLSEEMRSKYYQYLLPEPAGHPLSQEKTVFYPNNKYAIAGRNPVRLILIPYDKFGIVTDIDGCRSISILGEKLNCVQDDKRYFLDIYRSVSLSKKMNVKTNGVSKEVEVFFAPNCKVQIKECIFSPNKSIWYARAIVGDKLRQLLQKETQ